MLNPVDLTTPVQGKANKAVGSRISLKATLSTDPSKNIIVDIKIGDSLRNLQVLIGESMKTHFPDIFESLDGVRAFNITMEKDK